MKKWIWIALAATLSQSCKPKEQLTNGAASLGELTEEDYLAFQALFSDGLREKMLTNWDDARLNLEQALAINPRSTAARYELSGLYLRAGDLEGARHNIDMAIRGQEQNHWYKLRKAELELELGNLREAVKLYQEVVQMMPEVMQFRYELAQLHIDNGQYAEAYAVYDQMELKMGVSEELTFRKTELLGAMGQPEKAPAELEKLVAAYPGQYTYRGLLAESYAGLGQYEKAAAVYESLLETDPQNGYVQLSLANFHRLQGQRQPSEAYLEQAFANPELDLEAKLDVLGDGVYFQAADRDAQELYHTLLNLLIEAHPSDARAHQLFAEYLFDEGELERALDQYLKVIQLSSADIDVWLRLQYLNSQLNHMQPLYDLGEQSVSLFPNEPILYLYAVSGALELKQAQQALDWARMGLGISFDPAMMAEFSFLMAHALDQLGQYDKAEKAYADCLDLDPAHLVAKKDYALFLADRGQRLDLATRLVDEALAEHPGQPVLLHAKAWVMHRQGKSQEARGLMEQAFRNGLSGGPAYEHYGDILFTLGEKELALRQWRKALSEGGASEAVQRKIVEERIVE